MASTKEYLDFILEQLSELDEVSSLTTAESKASHEEKIKLDLTIDP